MTLAPTSSRGGSSAGGLTTLFDSTLSGSAASIDSGAGGFATTYAVLIVLLSGRTDEATGLSTVSVTFNNDTGANYDYAYNRGRGTTNQVSNAIGQTALAVNIVGNGGEDLHYASVVRFTIPAYGQTTLWKQVEYCNGTSQTGATSSEVGVWTGTYRATTAISRIKVAAPGGSNLLTGSRLTVLAT